MKLSAGLLSLNYEQGSLRWISIGEAEVLRMIYFAVRDKSWGTLPATIRKEKIKKTRDSFQVKYQCHHKQQDIELLSEITITGTSKNTIEFEIVGEALSTFQTNRIGLCVLHPIKECIGKPANITHTNGDAETILFPTQISPHQPFKDIKTIAWNVAEGIEAHIAFEGEIFETEDQRNWTDNSYKTYSTPLDLPFPKTVHKGDTIRQKITLSVNSNAPLQERNKVTKITFSDTTMPLPSIGTSSPGKSSKKEEKALTQLATLGLSHYRVDVQLDRSNWQKELKKSIREATWLNTTLDIALFLSEDYSKDVTEFCTIVGNTKVKCRITLLECGAKCISNTVLEAATAQIRALLSNATIGAGTNLNFTDLNRSNLQSSSLDFVQYSVNPQVHAFDDASLMENALGQGETVTSALYRFNKPVHVSPVTLTKRYNSNSPADAGKQVPLADKRQSTNFTAAWTLSSIKSLAENGAASATYFESLGKRGIGQFTKKKGLQLYPAGKLIRHLLANDFSEITKSDSSKSFSVVSLVAANKTNIIIANLTAKKQKVSLPLEVADHQAKDLLSGKNIKRTGMKKLLTLNAYQLVALQLSNNKEPN